MPTVEDVRTYWNSQPLFSHEVAAVGSTRYFADIDHIKRTDVERFAIPYWEFDQVAGQRLLDIGCGPGWLSVQYARGGARVTAVDLTEKAVALTTEHLSHQGVQGTVQRANAEQLTFRDGEFDFVVSSGVLHHTPDVQRALSEAARVLRPGGRAKITLYRKGILHSPVVFPITMALMRGLGVRHPGADMSQTATTLDDFIRQYDGADNPVGVAKTNGDWANDLRRAGFRVVGVENHYFPARFLPLRFVLPGFVHRLLDSAFGTMVYFTLEKAG
jgi:ubiquinone/menaquinone biosynthesis C-methylase UbiE